MIATPQDGDPQPVEGRLTFVDNLVDSTTDTIKREQTRTLAVDKQGRVYLNDIVKTPQQLRGDLASLARITPPVTILVKADAANNYGAVMDVMTQLHAAKITRIARATSFATTQVRRICGWRTSAS